MKMIFLIPALFIFGCASDRTCEDIAKSAAVIDAAAQSLPVSPQTKAIRANAQAIATAAGHPLEVNP
jgi:hypothetical protein